MGRKEQKAQQAEAWAWALLDDELRATLASAAARPNAFSVPQVIALLGEAARRLGDCAERIDSLSQQLNTMIAEERARGIRPLPLVPPPPSVPPPPPRPVSPGQLST